MTSNNNNNDFNSNTGGGAGAGPGPGGQQHQQQQQQQPHQQQPYSTGRSPFPAAHYGSSNTSRHSGVGGGTAAAATAAAAPTRARAVASRLSLEGGGVNMNDMMMTMMHHHNQTNNSSAVHSPVVQGLLRFSPTGPNHHNPNNNTSINATATTGTTGLSPFNRRNRTRFFEASSSISNNKNNNVSNVSDFNQQQQQQPQQSRNSLPNKLHATTSSSSNTLMDGIPVDQLRTWATQALLLDETTTMSGGDTSSSGEQDGGNGSSTFYASLLYSKTHLPSDALLLARAHLRSHQHAACLRILEESGLLQSDYPWEGLLLACAALAATGDWLSILEILQNACRLATLNDVSTTAVSGGGDASGGGGGGDGITHTTTTTAGFVTFRSLAAGGGAQQQAHAASVLSQPLEDDDDFGWDALKESIDASSSINSSSTGDTSTSSVIIHPLARLCWWRGRAHLETGHGLRAATYWKRALRMDCRLQQAWQALLERHLLSPFEAHEFLTTSVNFVISVRNTSGGDGDTNEIENNDGTTTINLEWLKALYLAKIELTTQDHRGTMAGGGGNIKSTSVDNDNNNNNNNALDPTSMARSAMEDDDDDDDNDNNIIHDKTSSMNNDTSAMSFSIMRGETGGPPTLDASSIQMMSTPMFTGGVQPDFSSPAAATTAAAAGAVAAAAGADTVGADDFHDGLLDKMKPIQTDVDQAFDKLWKEYKLHDSPQVLAVAARRAYRHYDWNKALQYCQQLSQLDPSLSDAAFSYVASLVVLGHKRVLFRLAHEWVEASPKSAKAWFAVGAYYFSCERYHVAQRHFCRATRLDPQCTEAWIAFGCSFAACDESDQALASFRAAQRLSPGEHTSLLYMGMEYVRTNHLVLAHYFLQSAKWASGGDPLCLHEIGVLNMQKGQHAEAVAWFRRALAAAVGGDGLQDSIDACMDPYWEPTLFNLGHAYRKTRQLQAAAQCFERCVSLCPEKHSTYSALAFTEHLQGHVDTAIEYYHQALSCKPDDSFSTEMLNRALKEALTMSNTNTPLTTNTASVNNTPAGAAAAGVTAQSHLFMSPGAPPLGLSASSISRKDDSMMSEETESSDVDMSGM